MQYDTRTFDQMIADEQPMTKLQELEQLYCEMHKDVYGVKARWYKAASIEHARADLERLGQALEAEIAMELEQQRCAVNAFESLAASYGGDIETAKRWQHEAYGTRGDDEFLEYNLGLPSGYFKRKGSV